MGSGQDDQDIYRRCASGRFVSCSSIVTSTTRSGRRSRRLHTSSGVPLRSYAFGYGRPNGIQASVQGWRAPTTTSSRSCGVRFESCSVGIGSFARRQRISVRRSSTAHWNDDHVHRRAQGRVRGRADLRCHRDRPIHLTVNTNTKTGNLSAGPVERNATTS
jgi:hypothetical protein